MAGAVRRGTGQFGCLLVGEAQAVAQPLGVLGDLDGQSREAEHGVGITTERSLEGGKSGEQCRSRRRAQHLSDEPVVEHHGRELGSARRPQQAQQLLAHALCREDRKAGALAHAGGRAPQRRAAPRHRQR